MRKIKAAADSDMDTVYWRPPAGYALALEVMRVSDLRSRGSAKHFARPQRIEFFILIGVTRGRSAHAIDSQISDARNGTWLLLRPGQTQRFDFSREWDGWVVVFRSDFLPPSERWALSAFHLLGEYLNDLPNVTRLAAADHAICCGIAERMHADAVLNDAAGDLNALLLYQICALLTRLKMRASMADADKDGAAIGVERHRVAQFRKLVDGNFRAHHDVEWYADRLGCTAKTLGRATLAVVGKPPKMLLSERLVIEAKRLLIHTSKPVRSIADDLGFDEPGNFVKFFKRHTQTTPTMFRREIESA